MNQTTYKINTDIVSTTMKDKPLICISEEAINLKRDNDNLKSIIKEVRELLQKANIYRNYDDDEDDTWYTDLNIDEALQILDKVGSDKE